MFITLRLQHVEHINVSYRDNMLVLHSVNSTYW